MDEKIKILIADDSEANRNSFASMLAGKYEVITARDGEEALAILGGQDDVRLVLSDVVMPKLDGFGLLAGMKKNPKLANIPVIMILAFNNPTIVHRAIEDGAFDYICRPFDEEVVKKRVENAVLAKVQLSEAEDGVEKLSFSREKNNDLMVAVLGHILEVRNGESGLHVLHINLITRILLNHLTKMTDKYNLSKSDINIIATASGLHDIGKIYVPEQVLNKPARLTKDEFEIMKTHAALGAQLILNMPFQDEPLLKYAHDICRWHHEKYDGGGYPDGLAGDRIPIWAQAVSVADVYDALTSVRVYKNAYSHEVALAMIKNGECGAFNPLLMQCLDECAETIREQIAAFNGNMETFDPSAVNKDM